MPKSPDVDRYIAKAAPFAQPILEKIRETFHAAQPDLEETIKWGAPFFEYKGVLGGMAAFKEHVHWMLWKAKAMSDPKKIDDVLSVKLKTVKDLLPKKEMIGYIREAIALNEGGVKLQRAAPKKSPVDVPDDLEAALKKNKKARAEFDKFPPGQRREYVQWITEAKQEATRQKRLATAVEWISEGKPRNWKYMK